MEGKDKDVKFISLFSGIGGFDLGFERAGMTCATQVEIDKNCLKLLGDKFPQAERYTDVKEFHYGKSIDLIAGGFPCQDVSVAGRRAGLAGERSGLWHEFHRIIAESRPGWVVIENVPGLLSSNEGRDFAVILRGLVECGYGVSWRILDAQYFGVSQRRRRVFVVGSLGNGRSAQVLFEREGGAGNNSESERAQQDIAKPLMASTTASGRMNISDENFIADTITTSYARNRGAQAGNAGKTHNLFSVGCLQAHSKTHGHAMTTQQAAESGQIVVGALHSGTPGRDASGAGNGHIVNGVRRLTPTECERLQGFPDNWTAGFADSVRYRMLGNAVAVPVAEWIARQIMQAEPVTFSSSQM
jgi:DNA (cytosine-5)-methyltransferase 1